MAIKRGPDGVPVDMPSVKNVSEPTTERSHVIHSELPITNDGPTLKTTGRAAAPKPNGLLFDEPPTAPARHSSAPANHSGALPTIPSSIDEPPTVVGRRGANQMSSQSIDSGDTTKINDPMADPISGWLVVVAGPGKGYAVKLGFGQNSIGRSPTERVCINFGDSQISRQNHATISYDPRGNQFYIQPGSGTNMTYLNDEPTPVLQPMILPPYSNIVIGDTQLRFVPLCGEQFSWDD